MTEKLQIIAYIVIDLKVEKSNKNMLSVTKYRYIAWEIESFINVQMKQYLPCIKL